MIVLIRSSGGFVRRYSFLCLKEAGCGAEPIFDGRTADSYRLPPINGHRGADASLGGLRLKSRSRHLLLRSGYLDDSAIDTVGIVSAQLIELRQ